MLALGMVPKIQSRTISGLLGLSGLMMIILAMLLIDKSSLFPGFNAIWPVLGAVLIILSGEQRNGPVYMLLSTKPFVFIGQISYSLYMWHWPIFVYAGLAFGFDRTIGEKLFLVAIAFWVAILSWMYIEKTTRGRIWRKNSKRVFTMTGAAMVLVTLVSFSIVYSDGASFRLAPEAVAAENNVDDFSPLRSKCHSSGSRAISYYDACVIGANVSPDTVLWGDSHGVELAYALGEALKQEGRSLKQVTSSACPPVAGFSHIRRPNCGVYNDTILESIIADTAVRYVILQAYWSADFYKDNFEELEQDFRLTVSRLTAAGKNVVIGMPYPSAIVGAPQDMVRSIMLRNKDTSTISKSSFEQQNYSAISFLRTFEGQNKISIVEGYNIFCEDECVRADKYGANFFDSSHLSVRGAEKVAPLYLLSIKNGF
ncbi:acyltransferase family protein [Halotalea alkalilenta]|uniref:acyltransferase family protein n=1 Tax=Halotalea alkalilenta TaxID=376489 RepID=UPI00123787D2|nr:acyltransferase family protein [Halotalea alkalilenta]